MPTKKRLGFTLVELLIVIAIIAILATIGFVIYGNITKEARDSKRKTDINAISTAMEVNFGKVTAEKYSTLCQIGPNSFDCNQWFSNGIPADPLAPNKKYCWIKVTGNNDVCDDIVGNSVPDGDPLISGAIDKPRWVICATLESGTLYCRYKQQ